jgi:hypothetical protein
MLVAKQVVYGQSTYAASKREIPKVNTGCTQKPVNWLNMHQDTTYNREQRNAFCVMNKMDPTESKG